MRNTSFGRAWRFRSQSRKYRRWLKRHYRRLERRIGKAEVGNTTKVRRNERDVI